VYGCYSLTPFAPKEDIESFIQYGFARTRTEDYVIDEPLATMAAWHWLDKNRKFNLFNSLQRNIGKHSPRENGFEAYLAFYMRTIFKGGIRLDEVFAFRSDFALRKASDLSWLKEKFELVTVSTSATTGERVTSVVTPSSGPSSDVGYLPQTYDDVVNWFSENNEQYTFCFPLESVGPDIFCWVRSVETGRLLLLAMQGKQYNSAIDKTTLVEGVRTVTPSWFFKSKDIKVGVTLNLTLSNMGLQPNLAWLTRRCTKCFAV
jgi:hypothetical protein